MQRQSRSRPSSSFFATTLCALVGLATACDPSSLLKQDEETTDDSSGDANNSNGDTNANGDPNGTPGGDPHGDSNGTPDGDPNGDPNGTPDGDPNGDPNSGECQKQVDECFAHAQTEDDKRKCEEMKMMCGSDPTNPMVVSCEPLKLSCEENSPDEGDVCTEAAMACEQSGCIDQALRCLNQAQTPEVRKMCVEQGVNCVQPDHGLAWCVKAAVKCQTEADPHSYACRAIRHECVEMGCGTTLFSCISQAQTREQLDACMPIGKACFGNPCRMDLDRCIHDSGGDPDVIAKCHDAAFECRVNSCHDHVKMCRESNGGQTPELCDALESLCPLDNSGDEDEDDQTVEDDKTVEDEETSEDKTKEDEDTTKEDETVEEDSTSDDKTTDETTTSKDETI
jgi:hypothetical protein